MAFLHNPRVVVPLLLAVLTIAAIAGMALYVERSKAASLQRSGVQIVATVDGRSITLQQVENVVSLPLYLLETQRQQLLLQAIHRQIDEDLIQAEASHKGLSVPELIDSASQSEAITRIANLPGPVKRVNDDGQEQARIRQALIVSLRRKADVQITLPPLEPPIVPVSPDDDPQLGPANAPVTIIEFSDFQCPFCQKSVAVLKELRRKYGDKIRVVYRDFPAQNHPDAFPAAEASQCAHAQGKFWQYHDLLFSRQAPETHWNFLALAAESGLDVESFRACVNSGRFLAEVRKDLEDGLRFGITSTPTFFINGRPLVGLQSVSAFEDLIGRALSEHTPPVARS